jgi:hypothetical protein
MIAAKDPYSSGHKDIKKKKKPPHFTKVDKSSCGLEKATETRKRIHRQYIIHNQARMVSHR